jgi:hypothetical protein
VRKLFTVEFTNEEKFSAPAYYRAYRAKNALPEDPGAEKMILTGGCCQVADEESVR